MDEKNLEHEEYTPRPLWQVWAARVALVVLIIGICGWLYFIAHPI